MRQGISTTARKNPIIRERNRQHQNIHAKSTGVTQVLEDSSFLKEYIPDLAMADIILHRLAKKKITPEENIKRLLKAATGYLALYERKLLFSPTGDFKMDMLALINAFSDQLPEKQELNIDYINNEFVFIVYQSNAELYWSTIYYIPLYIAEKMRPKIKRLYLRFCAFMKQQNVIRSITDTYDYEMLTEDIEYRMKEENEEIDEEYLEMYKSYKKKTSKANKLISRIEEYVPVRPEELLYDLKDIKNITIEEKAQIDCMIRGVELMSRDSLTNYCYNNRYDNFTNIEVHDGNGTVEWQNLICFSWGDSESDPVVECHFQFLNSNSQESETIEPYSFAVLSPDKQEKLPPCNYPFEWADYIEDYYKYLVPNE